MTDQETKYLQSIEETLKDVNQTLKLMHKEAKGDIPQPTYTPTPIVTADSDTHYEHGQRWYNLQKELDKRSVNIDGDFIDQFESMIARSDYSPIEFGWITRNGVKLVSQKYLELLDVTDESDLDIFNSPKTASHTRG